MLTVRVRRAESFKTRTGKRPFKEWMTRLKDTVGHARILARIRRAERGHFGACRDLRGGLFEMKENYGPGYRIYFGLEGDEIILLLIGGRKGTQDRDMEKARTHWEEHREQ
jgi:putative addiction module killer protein